MTPTEVITEAPPRVLSGLVANEALRPPPGVGPMSDYRQNGGNDGTRDEIATFM